MSSANLLVTALALVAMLITHHGLKAPAQRSDVARRLRTFCALTAILLLLRMMSPLAGGTALTVATMVVASWLPLAALRLVEELARRHASRWLKLLGLSGAVVFSVIAVTVGLLWTGKAIIALALFQLLMLLHMTLHLARARHDLSMADRRSAGAFLVALFLAAPLVLTDFHALFPDVQVRGGPFAVLLIALVSSAAGFATRPLFRLVADIALMLFAGAIALLAAEAAQVAPSPTVAGPAAALAGLLLLVERFARQPVSVSVGRLTGALASSSADSRGALLAAHPLLANGRLLGPDELADYPAPSLAQLLEKSLVAADADDADVRAVARDLLLAHGATHLLRLGIEPPLLLAVAAGELASPALDDELTVAARLIERTP